MNSIASVPFSLVALEQITPKLKHISKLSLPFSAVLEEHRKQCEAEGKYVEAEMAKNRIEELKIQDFTRRRETLIYEQAREREEVEQAHLMEYQDFNKRWDEALAQIEQQDQ